MLGVLESQFPAIAEARVFRIGLVFFKFMPRQDERPEEWLNRFDELFNGANRVGHLGLSVTFQSWMLFRFFQLFPKKWFELFKGLQHRSPQNRAEHSELQQAIIREKMFEGSIFDLRSIHARNVIGSYGGSYFISGEGVEPRPLYMCLGDPGGTGTRDVEASVDSGSVVHDGFVGIYDGYYVCEGDPESDVSSDAEQRAWEDASDPFAAEFAEFQGMIDTQVADLYWAMRRVVRRYRAAKVKFGPRRKCKGGRFKRQKGGKPGRGFHVGQTWVSFDEAPGKEIEFFSRAVRVASRANFG